jgi:hypothetical protein
MTDPNAAALACARCGAVLADPAGHVCEVDRLRAENERLRVALARLLEEECGDSTARPCGIGRHDDAREALHPLARPTRGERDA